ncbi:MAG: DUF3302 domain-containing protein [Psychromonas sp.]|nr:DUF3302 domain-containing protein [Psychromonas sp.]
MLEYVALGLLVFVALTLFYGIIAVHDIPYEIAVHRNHPQQDAIHVAGWISLFTLHALWPFLWIWATLYREDRGWGFINKQKADSKALKNLQKRVELLEKQPIVTPKDD